MTGLSAREHQDVRQQARRARNLFARWRRRTADRDHRDKRALADRLRRELVDFEAGLERAAAVFEAAKAEERDAELALLGRNLPESGKSPPALEAAERRLGHARKGRELAGLASGIARARVDFHSGALFQLEHELAESDEE